MRNISATVSFKDFVDSTIFLRDYREIYELYQAAIGNDETQNTFRREIDPHGQIIITYEPTKAHLVLTQKTVNCFLKWIIKELMDGMDPELYFEVKRMDEEYLELSKD